MSIYSQKRVKGEDTTFSNLNKDYNSMQKKKKDKSHIAVTRCWMYDTCDIASYSVFLRDKK